MSPTEIKAKYIGLSLLLITISLLVGPSAESLSNPLTSKERERYKRYQADTIRSLDAMRGANGLVNDRRELSFNKKTKTCDVSSQKHDTSPTNIGLDILVQVSRLKDPAQKEEAQRTLKKILSTLTNLKRHPDSGLFFSWYSTDDGTPLVQDVSAVDNIHLALALWTLTQLDGDMANVADDAKKIFDKMDNSIFYNPSTGLMSGNLAFDSKSKKWKQEDWEYSSVGSEARSIYTLTWALKLLKSKKDPDFVAKSVAALQAECTKIQKKTGISRVLRVWDGGVFQLFLPKILAAEENYSPFLKESFNGYSHFMLDVGSKTKHTLPLACSAASSGVSNQDALKSASAYKGGAGVQHFMSTQHQINRDLQQEWCDILTPHAVFMAATTEPQDYLKKLKKIEKIKTKTGPLYCGDQGFVDGYYIDGPHEGLAVPAQLSLDQAMTSIALDSILSKNKMSASAAALEKNPETFNRLKQIYRELNEKLENTPCDPGAGAPHSQKTTQGVR